MLLQHRTALLEHGEPMRARRQRNLSRHQKFFCKNVFHRKAYPLYRDGTIFGQVFVRGGMIKISKWKVPPYRGSIARRQPFDGLTALGARLCSLLRPSRGLMLTPSRYD